MKQPLYKAIARKLQAIENCKQSNNLEWLDKHTESLAELVYNYMPSGSGIDSGIILHDTSTPNKLVFVFSFHHMNEAGYYTQWTEHKLSVTASLVNDFDMNITGKNHNDIKDYLYDTFDYCLRKEVEG